MSSKSRSKSCFIVTGGAGFIGSQLAKTLEKSYPDSLVVIFDDFSHGDCENLLDFGGAVKWHSFDNSHVYEHLDHYTIRAIFHFAAFSRITDGSDRESMFRQNVQPLEQLVKYAWPKDIPVIFASSASVYGNGHAPMAEGQRLQPQSDYAWSKFLAEKSVLSNIIKDNAKVCCLRIFNAYGPGETHKATTESCSPVLKFYNEITGYGPDKPKVKLFEGSERLFRDFIHIDDVVRAAIAVFEKGAAGVFNVGTGVSTSFHDVAFKVAMSAGLAREQFAVLNVPMNPLMKHRYQRRTCANTKKAEEELGFKASVSIDDGIDSYMKFLQERDKNG